MSLKLAGGLRYKEKLERIAYAPGLQDTGDLEAATRTITATAEASGLGNADYNAALTLAKPSDARLVVSRLAERLRVTIDSMTAGTLYCRVYIDSQVAANRLFDLSWTTTGAKIANAAQTSGTIFDLLGDGAAHTFYFFFWVNAGNAVLSLVQLEEAWGAYNLSGGGVSVGYLSYKGEVQVQADFGRSGTGTFRASLRQPANSNEESALFEAGDASGVNARTHPELSMVHLVDGQLDFWFRSTSVATDLIYIGGVRITLRSEP